MTAAATASTAMEMNPRVDEGTPLKVLGNPGSPYSRKLRAALRYLRVPHQWVLRSSPDDRETPEAPTPIIPVLVFPGADGAHDEATVDTTFQIRRLDAMIEVRHIIPNDPALAFLDFLIEDFADEWLTKAMYHYRWSFSEAAEQAEVLLPMWMRPGAPRDAITPLGTFLGKRQVGRRALVGINDITAPLIESTYLEVLHGLDAHLTGRRFVFGERPGLSDFGLFGQLSQLVAIDPVSTSVARTVAPRIIAWCHFAEDLSGIHVQETSWIDATDLPSTLHDLLRIAGKYYAPFLLANSEAVAAGAAQVECEIDGRPWVQPPFGYQAKCLGWLRDAYRELPHASRQRVDQALSGTGCEPLFPTQGKTV